MDERHPASHEISGGIASYGAPQFNQSYFTGSVNFNLQANDSRDRLFAWLSPLEPQKRHQDVSSKRHPNTGQWFLNLDKFQQWRSSAQGVFYCYGIPGSGKTILTSLVLDRVFDTTVDDANSSTNEFAASCLYCDYRDARFYTIVNMLGAILKQLVAALPTVPDFLTNEWKNANKRGLSLTKIRVCDMLKRVCTMFPGVLVCVDAIDEIEDERARLDLLKELRVLPAMVFLTSRQHLSQQIQDRMEPQYLHELLANDEDIMAFITETIDDDPYPELMDDQLKAEIISKISEHHSGMFLLCDLQLRSVLEARRKHHRREALSTLPQDLNRAYETTIKRIQSQSSSWAKEGSAVLKWVAFASRALSVDELQHAIAIEPGNYSFNTDMIPPKTSILNYCLGLVVEDKESETVRLVHATLQEYINNDASLLGSPHGYIASACLTYLSYDGIIDEAKTTTFLPVEEPLTSWLESDLTRVRSRLARAGFPLYEYAAGYWGYHAAQDKEGGYVKLAIRLFEKRENFSVAKEAWLARIQKTLHCPWMPSIHDEISGISMAVYHNLMPLLCSTPIGELGTDNELHKSLLLHWASLGGHEGMIAKLLAEGFDVNCTDSNLTTALHLVCVIANRDIFSLLIDRGADWKLKDTYGATPLFYATDMIEETITEARTCIIQDLLAMGADPNSNVIVGFPAIVGDYTISFRRVGDTPLHNAARRNCRPVVLALLEHGASLEAKDDEEETPFYSALETNSPDAAWALVERGCKLHVKDRDSYTTLHQAILEIEGHNMAYYLISRGADVNAQDESGSSCLHMAVYPPAPNLLNALIDAGADIETRDDYGYTPFHLAIRFFHKNEQAFQVLKTLIERGADIHAETPEGESALQIAAYRGDEELIQFLRDSGCK